MLRKYMLFGAIALAVAACDPTGPAPHVTWSGRAAGVDSNGDWDIAKGLSGGTVTAYVYTAANSVSTTTDANGDFELRIPSPDDNAVACDQVHVEISAPGFQPYRASLLEAGESEESSQGCPMDGTIHSFLVLLWPVDGSQ